jgi:hypothetical protein
VWFHQTIKINYILMKKYILILIIFTPVSDGCVVQFMPDVDENSDYIVVECLITDQNTAYQVSISRSWEIDPAFYEPPEYSAGYNVYVTDDLGNQYDFKQNYWGGLYRSDPLKFRGVVGRIYILHIISPTHSYQSKPMELKPVPPIDSLYAEVVQNTTYKPGEIVPGYQLFVAANDPLKRCNFYKWKFTETWEFRLPFIYETIINRICWKTAYSNKIYIKNTSVQTEDKVAKFPLNFITTETDRLKVKYSILVEQYSLNQDEYNYLEKIHRMAEDVGGLYDIVPMTIESNIYCTDNPDEKVLGYFSVSSVTSKRLFIKNTLTGFPDFYNYCPTDTVPANRSIPGLNVSVFILDKLIDNPPPYGSYVLTNRKECVDCTRSGSNVIPPFWNETKNDVVIQNVFQ